MDALLEHLEEVIEQTRATVTTTLGAGDIIHASDDAVVQAMRLAAELQRLTDAVLIETVGEVSRRSVARDRDLRLTSRLGCRDVTELVQRVTLLAPATATRLQRAAKPTMVAVSLAGDPLDARLPAIRAALIDGTVGIDGLLAVTGPLDGMGRRVGVDNLHTADRVLAAEARGEGPDGSPPACADLLRIQAHVWATLLDPDGAEPQEDRALHHRGITLGRARDGIVPIRGNVLAEVAAQLQRIDHAINSPRVDEHGP